MVDNINIFELNEEEMYDLLISNHKFTEREIKDIVYGNLFCHDKQEFDSGRCTQRMLYIMKVSDKLFAIPWDKSLTESQENEFCYQPYEVICQEKVITMKDYVKVRNE